MSRLGRRVSDIFNRRGPSGGGPSPSPPGGRQVLLFRTDDRSLLSTVLPGETSAA